MFPYNDSLLYGVHAAYGRQYPLAHFSSQGWGTLYECYPFGTLLSTVFGYVPGKDLMPKGCARIQDVTTSLAAPQP